MCKFFRILGVCLLAVLLAGPAAAQTGTGRIVGVVKDATGGVVPGVTVRATHEPTGIVSETVTNQTGGYVFPSLSVGPYTLTVELQGFATVTSTKNVLTVGSELRIDATLHPGGLAEAVTVTETAVRVQTTESSLSTLVPGKTIETLPLNGRNPLHLIGLVPGVVGHSAEATASGGTSTQQINGDRGRGITTTQDGIDIADPVIPRGELTNAPVNPDALQEFRVITSNAKAEYGRSAGGQVELLQRAEQPAEGDSRAEAVRGVYRRPDQTQPRVLLLQLRRHAPAAGDQPDHHRADRHAAQRPVPVRHAGLPRPDQLPEPAELRGRVGQPAGARVVVQPGGQ
jgi:hypothetical protein